MKMKQFTKDSIRNKDITDDFFISKRIVSPQVVINPLTEYGAESENLTYDPGKENILSANGIEAAASSLLLNLRLHDWLSDNEKDFLDNLATDTDLVFLIKGDKYFHPEDLELFPSETIRSCTNVREKAIFSQKYYSISQKSNSPYRIRTAYIDNIDDENLILGKFGPDSISDKDKKDNHFHQLVELFRNSSKFAAEALFVLEQKLDVSNPIFIVNRASGYIIHVNSEAASLLSMSLKDLSGAEFSKISNMMNPIISQYKMNIENITSNEMSFSVVKLLPKEINQVKTARKILEESNVELRGPISTIVTAASILESDNPSPETKRLAGVILDEVQDVDHCLKLQTLLTSFSNLEMKNTNLQYEAENAIDRFSVRKNFKGFIELQTEPKLPLITAPDQSYMSLIYSILGVHSKATQNNGRTTVKIYNRKNDNKIIICISSKSQTSASSTLTRYVETKAIGDLAEKLDVTLNHSFNSKQKSIDTNITVNSREISNNV